MWCHIAWIDHVSWLYDNIEKWSKLTYDVIQTNYSVHSEKNYYNNNNTVIIVK